MDIKILTHQLILELQIKKQKKKFKKIKFIIVMFNIIFLTFFLQAKSLISNDFSSFKQYIKTYDKSYNNTEMLYRYKIFQNNTDFINNKNNKNLTYKLGLNNFTDWSYLDFRHTYLKNTISRTNNHYNNIYQYKNLTIPTNIDWRANGYVTDVKNQGMCGSCWAFSAIGAIEGQHANFTKQLVSLSEQNLVDCTLDYNCSGCEGGWPDKAMDYVIKYGVDTELSYPYNAVDQTCNYNKSNVGANISQVVLLPEGNMTTLYEALGTVGPLSIAIDAEDDFQFYSSGVFKSTTCSPQYLDHAVLAVGYGETNDNKKYIIVKNSWGTSWGMDGYIYMSSDIDNMCGMAEHVSFPLIK